MSFKRFRPTSHFIAPHSWSNDPCGACYIPETKEYIVCYQWNPGTTEAGNCAWGMAKSNDLITWVDCSPALCNGDSYDSLGVFSGCIVPQSIEGKTVLFLFYTSVSALPIHWSKPYLPACESQSAAISVDFGASWHRQQSNPLLRNPPRASDTTGWRDPFVSHWASLSKLLNLSCDTKYMLIASGVKNHGPQLHIYKSRELCGGWEYISPLIDAKIGAEVSEGSPYKFGTNFECASFFSLGETDYIAVGVEETEDSTRHSCRYTLWLSGSLVLENGKPKFAINSHAELDYGILYAPHVFRDNNDRLLQLGWADEDAERQVVLDQGWAGCLTFPRELFNLSRPLDLEVAKTSSRWLVDESKGTMTTLGIRPAPQLTRLRCGNALPLHKFAETLSTTYEISATFTNLSGRERFIFNVRQSPDSAERTQLIFDIAHDSITVDRSRSSIAKLGTCTPDTANFQLLRGEDLHIRIFVDVSVVEIYANDRFALTSRIYPFLESSVHASYDLGSYNEDDLTFSCWDTLETAWPDRKIYSTEVDGAGVYADPKEERLRRANEDTERIPLPVPSTA